MSTMEIPLLGKRAVGRVVVVIDADDLGLVDSRCKGVCWNRSSRKWQVIKVNGKNRYLGVYVSEEEAALIYDAAAREAHGEFAYLNFPEVA